MDFKKQLYRLTQIGISLCKERDIDTLLEKILAEARAFTNAEGGSLYIREGDELCFMVTQNERLPSRNDTRKRCILTGHRMPVNKNSAAGYVALTGETVNIENAYNISPDSPYKVDDSFDRQNNYVTSSMLLVPMQETNSKPIGVLALVNALNRENKPIPFVPEYESLVHCLASHAAVALRNARLNEELHNAYLDTIIRLCRAAEYRDKDTAAHLKRISLYSCILARQLGFSREYIENIRYASPMHDVGKIGVPDSVLLKPGKLTSEEYEQMKQHTTYGAEILAKSKSEILKLSEEIALSHHEKYDGSGYPKGLKGEEIPWSGRIVALADVFDALLSKRCYKEAWNLDTVLSYIRGQSGAHFDPKVVEAFNEALPEIVDVAREHSMIDSVPHFSLI